MRFELDKHKLDEVLQHIATSPVDPRHRKLIETVFGSYNQLIHSLKDENTTMDQLQELLAAANREMTEAMTDSETKSETPPVPLEDDDGTESS